MNVDTTSRNIKRMDKSSFRKRQKREGLGIVDVNRLPQQPNVEPKRGSMDMPGLYSPEELVSIRRNLRANLTLAKRRMMARLSQSSVPKDVQMYQYLTDSDKKRRTKGRKQHSGGKLKQHRPRPLMAPPTGLASGPSAPAPVAAAEPVVPLDILFGGNEMTMDEEEPGSLCDPSSSPLMPACVRDPEESEEAMWDMSNHAAGLLSNFLCNENEHIISGEPIDLWLPGTMAMSDQDMSGKASRRACE
ncbi:hypothetical protein BJV82DRAFT_626809 [Fennellomyces sp. T-0311]|nr:hypothetical protein BJV82DRAFT_626809 [Fennellomyces sp. T-0311]